MRKPEGSSSAPESVVRRSGAPRNHLIEELSEVQEIFPSKNVSIVVP
jgi:hypothetical protein